MKRRSKAQVFFMRIRFFFSGPWWVRLWAPKENKRWEWVLAQYYLQGMVRSPVTDKPMESTIEEIADWTGMHIGHIMSATDALEGRGLIERIGYFDHLKNWREGHCVTPKGREVVVTHELIHEGYNRRGSVVWGTIKAAVLILGLPGGLVGTWRLFQDLLPDKGPPSSPPSEQQVTGIETPMEDQSPRGDSATYQPRDTIAVFHCGECDSASTAPPSNSEKKK